LKYNPKFKGNEFETFKKQAGLNTFNLTPRKWIEATDAIWMMSKAWRYGWWTYAHKDIAFEFASWLSPEFKLYLIKEYADEADVLTNEVISWQRSHQRPEKFLYGRKYVVFTTDYHRLPQMTTDETTEIKG